jgi:putative Mg2+ transporter-C (MgtC) family protein
MVGCLLISYLLSGLIGWERKQAQRPAGLRTHILVGLGSTGFMLISSYGFEGMGTVRDPARVAAQIITGIGFLGAGTIWRSDSQIGGLTTAASIWITAAIGMMVGAHMFTLAGCLTGMGWFTLRWLKPQNHRNGRIILKKSPPVNYGEPSLVQDHQTKHLELDDEFDVDLTSK